MEFWSTRRLLNDRIEDQKDQIELFSKRIETYRINLETNIVKDRSYRHRHEDQLIGLIARLIKMRDHLKSLQIERNDFYILAIFHGGWEYDDRQY